MKWAMAIVLGLAAIGCRRPDSKRPSARELAAAAEDPGTGDGTVLSIPGFRPARDGRPAVLIVAATEPEFATSGAREDGSEGEADAELQAFVEKAASQGEFDEPLEIPDHLIERK